MERLYLFFVCSVQPLKHRQHKVSIYLPSPVFRIGVGVGAGVGVDQEPGVGAGVGVGTAPPRLRIPGQKWRNGCFINYAKFQSDPPSGSAAISEKNAGGITTPPNARARGKYRFRRKAIIQSNGQKTIKWSLVWGYWASRNYPRSWFLCLKPPK